MKMCNCSTRPLGILDSRVIVENDIPYQVLYLAVQTKAAVSIRKKCGLKKLIFLTTAILPKVIFK